MSQRTVLSSRNMIMRIARNVFDIVSTTTKKLSLWRSIQACKIKKITNSKKKKKTVLRKGGAISLSNDHRDCKIVHY